MAFEKHIISSTHAPAVYHRLTQVDIVPQFAMVRGTVASFYSKEARDANAGALGSYEFTLTGADYPFSTEDIAALRTALALTDEQSISGVRMSFHGAETHVMANIASTLFGKQVTNELNLLAPTADLPIPVQAQVYEKLRAHIPDLADATDA